MAVDLVASDLVSRSDVVGTDVLMDPLAKQGLEAALEAQMIKHLGYAARLAGPQRSAGQDQLDRRGVGRDQCGPRPRRLD
ncbi:hypothetical protein Kisp01_69410 [Kineosporia sp. NBRC 101677]|nr:hypothetical protein Kisp01_69410 [Kineosporia sp. NBRC 101677]